jgi:flagella basal body P-ring formation protein FlgA
MLELLFNIMLCLLFTSNNDFDDKVDEYIHAHFTNVDSLSYSIQEDINYYSDIQINTKRKSSLIGNRFFVPIRFRDAYGNNKEKFLTANVNLFHKVRVVNSVITKGSIISKHSTSIELRNITKLNNTPFLNEEAIGDVVTKIDLQPGTVICNEFLENKPVLESGDQINLVYQFESVAVSMIGTVRQAGAIGDIIKVKTDSRQYSAKIINNREALIVE